jgi:hypothetical protein
MAERTSPTNVLYVDIVKYLTQLGTPGNAAFGYIAFDEASMAGTGAVHGASEAPGEAGKEISQEGGDKRC